MCPAPSDGGSAFVLENGQGMRFACIGHGATITELRVPDRLGQRRNVLLSLPDLAAYQRTRRRFAAMMGRYAGRIAGASFMLDGARVQLPANADGLHLHGDPDGFDKRVWQGRYAERPDARGVLLRLVSPDGDGGFPGELEVEVGYWLLHAENTLHLEITARTTRPTVLNLTNHAFFNLAGAGTRGLDTHVLQIEAAQVAVTDARNCPTGALAMVDGSPLDFRRPARLGWRIAAIGEPGFDHSYVFNKPDGVLAPVALVHERVSGRCLQILTTEPAAQFFSGNGFDGSEIGSEGLAYQRHDGFAFETQHLPDSPNHAHFPSTVLRPGQTYTSLTVWRFCTL
ncbi:aldose epimerase family protein [Massilia sp. TS11]|uniref:aldose epimerase family protein n=1 Tax=Massilia sp. TS11 TaxID=2908003 RepID=UPI001EDA287B|nr:aldose epimerase family protein [Massilia sp. TS11]MCG2583776.1 galactose mutarotase [Massilia sp. TS11]